MHFFENVFETTITLLKKIIELSILLLIVGIIVGFMFNDPFKVIAHITAFMATITDKGMAGILTIFLIAVVYWKK